MIDGLKNLVGRSNNNRNGFVDPTLGIIKYIYYRVIKYVGLVIIIIIEE
jgi:hypothetical protein